MATVRSAPGFTLGEHVTPAEQAFYDDNGFIAYTQAVGADELALIRREIEALHDRTLRGEIPPEHRDDLTPPSRDADGNVYLHRLPYVTKYCDGIAELLHVDRFRALGRGHLGSDVWMLEDTMHGVIWQMKRGGSHSSYSEIRWHIDFRDDHILSPVMSAGIYLDRSTVDNGCLAVVPGSHRYPPTTIPPVPYHIEAEPGDIVCHAHNIYHGSGPARAEADKRATLYVYFCGGEHPGAADAPFASDEVKTGVRQLFVGAGGK